MTRLEDRLRDAFGAAAETVRPESVAGLPDPARPTRTRHVAPIVAAAAVAAVIIGASVITPLALAGGGSPSRPAGSGVSPSGPASPSSAAVAIVPNVAGMTVNQAMAVLQSAGFLVVIENQYGGGAPAGTVVAENPAAGTGLVSGGTVTVTVLAAAGASQTVTLAAPRHVTFSAYAVTIAIEQTWQSSGTSGLVYRGADGFVQVGAVAEAGGLQAACAAVASQHAYGSHPQISDRSIDGRPGCLIIPSGDAPAAFQPAGGPELPRTSALVAYRQPLSDGDNFLLISTDPPHLQQIVGSVQLHH